MTMQRILIIAIGLVIAAGAVLFFLLWMMSPNSSPAPGGQLPGSQVNVPPYGTNVTVTPTGTTTPAQPPVGPTRTVLTINSNPMPVRDFIASTSTVPDPNNKGNYFIAGQITATSSPEYSILYTESDQSFNITLLSEPLAFVRARAEQDFVQKVGIKQVQACNLRYRVGVPNYVNEFYSGKNLGFSFCPGATKL